MVHTDQVGYIKGRYIGENIRKIEDIINYTSLKNVPGSLALIDFQKAFDAVEWPCLFQTLKRFNFGEYFISWIRLLYTNISSCVSNNGYISNYFTLTRGIRQGCPISALLFILVAEILAINIRTNLNIKGLTINNCEFKIAQLADDTTLFLADLDSLKTAIEMFKNFGIVSGLKLNLDKTEVVPVGGMQFSKYNLARSIQEISIKTGPFRTLGVWFTTDMAASIDLNFGTRLRNMEQILYTWTSRSLSWKGKIVILKSLVIPQVTHLLSNTYVPNDVLDKIDRMLFKFLWQNGPSRVKRKTIINNLESGGLKMPDIYAFHTAQKCLWIKRLLDDNKKNWKALANELIGIDLNLLDHKLSENDYKVTAKTKFYQQVLDCWFQVKSRSPITDTEISNEYLLFNKFIRIADKCLDLSFVNGNDLLKKIQLKDIIDLHGNLLPVEEICKKFPLKFSMMKYQSPIHAIPKTWKCKVNTDDNSKIDNRSSTFVTINKTLRPITDIKSQDIYWELVNNKCEPPTSLNTWVDLFPFLECIDWPKVYTLSNRITTEPYLQSFQYKILNRTLNCRYNLFNWKIVESPTCLCCNDELVDTIEHHLFCCESTRIFWRDLHKWLKSNSELCIVPAVCEILLGIPFDKDLSLLTINYIFLLSKWFINNRKSQNKPVNFIDFPITLKNKLKALQDLYIFKGNIDIFNKSFGKILDILEKRNVLTNY